jgi:FkbM family methyltransferase
VEVENLSMSSIWRLVISQLAKTLPSKVLILMIRAKIFSDFLFSLAALLVGKPEMDKDFQAADLDKEIVPGQTVVEIGANIGGLTVFLSQLVGVNGKVICFEPNPIAFGLLERNTKRLRNVSCYNLAVGRMSTEDQIAGNDPTDTSFSRFKTTTNYKFAFRVKVVSLDEFLSSKSRKVDWLVIDAEGAELDILKGSRNIISSMKPKMFVETHPYLVPEIDLAVVEYLEKYGYSSQTVRQDRNLVTFKFIPNFPGTLDFYAGKSSEPVI